MPRRIMCRLEQIWRAPPARREKKPSGWRWPKLEKCWGARKNTLCSLELFQFRQSPLGVRQESVVHFIQHPHVSHIAGHFGGGVILRQLDPVMVAVLPVPGARLAALQFIIPVSHQMRLRGDESVVAVAGRQTYVIERQAHYVSGVVTDRL